MWGDFHDAATSYSGWWKLAGLDVAMAEKPHDWLAKAAPKSAPATPARILDADRREAGQARSDSLAAPKAAPPVAAPPVSELALPHDLPQFQQWMATSADVPGASWSSQRLGPSGVAGSRFMVAIACPETVDFAGGQFFTGATEKLFDAMLAAIGATRDDCYFASLAPTRPPSGRIPPREAPELTRIFWHHVAIAAPKSLILIGNPMAQLAVQKDVAEVQGRLLQINQDGVITDGIAILHPRMLLERPALKASAWASLKQVRLDQPMGNVPPC